MGRDCLFDCENRTRSCCRSATLSGSSIGQVICLHFVLDEHAHGLNRPAYNLGHLRMDGTNVSNLQLTRRIVMAQEMSPPGRMHACIWLTELAAAAALYAPRSTRPVDWAAVGWASVPSISQLVAVHPSISLSLAGQRLQSPEGAAMRCGG